MERLEELIRNEASEIKKYVGECSEEQLRNNSIFFDNILELAKASFNKEIKENNNKIVKTIEEMEKINKLNKAISEKLIDELKEVNELLSILKEDEDEKNNSLIIYKNMKEGIKQYAIQTAITAGIILITLGGYQLVKLFF